MAERIYIRPTWTSAYPRPQLCARIFQPLAWQSPHKRSCRTTLLIMHELLRSTTTPSDRRPNNGIKGGQNVTIET